MKTTKKTVGVFSTLLAASMFAFTPLAAQIAWTGVGTYTQNFSGFDGTSGTLPTGFFVESAQSPSDPFVPGGGGGTVDGTNSTIGFRTFRLITSPVDSNKRWFGIFEGSGLGDSRLFAEIENTSGAPITALRVRYRAAIWRDGARQNSLRLKYNNSTGGFSSVSDSDVWVAKVNAGGNVAYDGNATAYSDQRDVIITLPTPLPNNSTGYLRWQYSTNSGSGTRDGLGITDIQIDAISEGSPLGWDGGSGNWSDANWDGDVWTNGGKAIFSGTGSTVAVDDDFEVNGIQFNSTGWTLSDATGLLQLAGSVTIGNAAHTATINADIEGVDLVKSGSGTLVLGGNADLTGDIKLFAGTVRIGSGFTVSDTARVDLGNNTTFDLDGNDLTVRGLNGSESGTVDIDSAILTLKQEGSGTSYRGAITGNGDIIKTGIGEQEFQDTVKVYTGDTVVDQGTLAVTLNGIPTDTAGVYLNGPETIANPDGYGELLLNRDETYLFGSALVSDPSITLEGGWLSTDTNIEATLQNPLVLVQPAGVDDDAQGRPDLGNQIYARGANGLLELTAAITGTGGFRKQGQGELILSNSGNTYSGGTNIRNGKLTIPSGGSLGAGALLFTDDEEVRTLELGENATVSLLDGNSADPAVPGNVNNAFLEIASGKTLTVDQAAEVVAGEEITTRFQGEISGAGDFVKDGTGYLAFTRYAKVLTGDVTINDGVLEVSAPSELFDIASLSVESGGQLRLTSNSTGYTTPRLYEIGKDNVGFTAIQLKSAARSLDIPAGLVSGAGFGENGGLRYDPGADAQSAILATPINVAASAAIHLNGIDKRLELTGALTGSSALSKSGGGKLVINGTASGYTGTLTIKTSDVVIASGKSLGGSVVIDQDGDTAPALAGFGTVSGSVTVTEGLLSPGERALTDGTVTETGINAIGTLTVGTSVTVASGSSYVVEFNGTSTRDQIVVGGNLTLVSGSVVEVIGAGSLPSGNYVIATVSGSISNSATLSGSVPVGSSLAVSGSNLVLSVP